jgi:hypothetical protein
MDNHPCIRKGDQIMNLDEYKKFVSDKKRMSRIDAMAILANAKKQNELIHSQKENGEN